MTEKAKAVLDVGIILQAALNRNGPAGQVISLLQKGKIEVYTSPLVQDETEDVLYRSKIRQKYPRLTDGRTKILLQTIKETAIMITHHFRSLDYPRDPKDEPILNLALHVRADFLVARDRDLLDLEQSRDFRLLYPFLHILLPLEFLRQVSARQTETPAA